MKFSVMSAIGFVGGIVFGILSLTQSGKLVLPQDSKRPGTNGVERQIQAFNPPAVSGEKLPPARPNVAEVVAGSGLATAPEMESNLRYKVQLLDLSSHWSSLASTIATRIFASPEVFK